MTTESGDGRGKPGKPAEVRIGGVIGALLVGAAIAGTLSIWVPSGALVLVVVWVVLLAVVASGALARTGAIAGGLLVLLGFGIRSMATREQAEMPSAPARTSPGSSSSASAQSPGANPVPRVTVPDNRLPSSKAGGAAAPVPSDEAALCKIVEDFERRAQAAGSDNEMQLAQLRKDRAKQLVQVVGRGSIKNWVVRTSSTGTDGRGYGYARFALPCGGSIGTATPPIGSDQELLTLLDPGSPVFTVIAKLGADSPALVSGQLLSAPRSSRDHFDTLNDDSDAEEALNSPDFVMRVSEVRTVPH